MKQKITPLFLLISLVLVIGCSNPAASSNASGALTLKTMMEQLPDMTSILSAGAAKQVARSIYSPGTETVIAYTGQYTLTGGVHFLFADLIQYAKYNIGALDIPTDTDSALPSGYFLDSTSLQDFGKLRWSSSDEKAEIWWTIPTITSDQMIKNKGIDAYLRFTKSSSSSSAWDVELYLHVLPPDDDSSYDQYWLLKIDGDTESIIVMQDFVNQPYDAAIVSTHASDGGTFFCFGEGNSSPLMSMIANAEGKAVKWNGTYEYYTPSHDLVAATDESGNLAYRLRYLDVTSGSIGLDTSDASAMKAWLDQDSNGILDGDETAVSIESLGFGMKPTAYNGYTTDLSYTDTYAIAADSEGVLPSGFTCKYQSALGSLTAAVNALTPPSAPDFSALRSEISGLTSTLSFPAL